MPVEKIDSLLTPRQLQILSLACLGYPIIYCNWPVRADDNSFFSFGPPLIDTPIRAKRHIKIGGLIRHPLIFCQYYHIYRRQSDRLASVRMATKLAWLTISVIHSKSRK